VENVLRNLLIIKVFYKSSQKNLSFMVVLRVLKLAIPFMWLIWKHLVSMLFLQLS